MHIILLSGGSGKRLWPLSNDIRSKQFIKIFRREDGSYESMVQQMYREILAADPEASVSIATSKSQVSVIHNQLGENVGISVEPCRRDTFPAIALATLYLRDVRGVGGDEAVVVCPCDPYVDREYFRALKRLGSLAEQGAANLCLLGMEPTYPSEKYGYIVPETGEAVSRVSSFKEKPDRETAERYIARGGLWNGGVFAYKLDYMVKKAHELLDFTDYQDLFRRYETLERISFDYAVAEKEPDIAVMRFSGQWKDLGTWNTLTEAMEEPVLGNAVLGDGCENVHVINELSIPILCMGLKNAVVSASPQGILVSDKGQSSYIRKYVENIDDRVMFAEKSWGTYRVVNVESDSVMVMNTLNAGAHMSYHSHEKRTEILTVISGTGRIVVEDAERCVGAGDVVTVHPGERHTIAADTELKLFELQLGEEIAANDKMKYPYSFCAAAGENPPERT
ncbi:sugar phosphate nucleotidyltransferase [Lachnoclostridium sp. Marseille-P6806]|uniref:sugar phosphate nucleotidyltransferase n=1 Tax=Lachnoclostridium sp. Marseille-P6806 TaxID=2364793 RepID=UPI00102FBAF8|nr:sugar phosphate nucleotidyltransferase [Lachnoclostridium sp. Marseille-P6806]